tara:strand:- start:651 stop:1016 length:366 start_codon:yes stop_codon:yes gene_type:complete
MSKTYKKKNVNITTSSNAPKGQLNLNVKTGKTKQFIDEKNKELSFREASILQQKLKYRSDVQKERLRNLDMEEKRLRLSKRNRSEKVDEQRKINNRRKIISNQFTEEDESRLNQLNKQLQK